MAPDAGALKGVLEPLTDLAQRHAGGKEEYARSVVKVGWELLPLCT